MIARLDLSPQHLHLLCSLLRQYIPDVTVLAYGSRVKGTARPYSDLDLVVFPLPGQQVQIGKLKYALDESNLPFLVDVLIWEELPESFHRTIAERYVVVQVGQSPPPTPLPPPSSCGIMINLAQT